MSNESAVADSKTEESSEDFRVISVGDQQINERTIPLGGTSEEGNEEESQEASTDKSEEQASSEQASSDSKEEAKTEESVSKEEETKTESQSGTDTSAEDEASKSAEQEESQTEEQQAAPEVDKQAIVNEALNSAFDGKFKTFEEINQHIESSTVLKDDYIKKVVDVYNKTGDLTAFVDATKHKFEDMSPLQVLKHKFDKERQGMDPEARDALFHRDVVQRFKQDKNEEYSDNEVRIGTAEMEFEAEKERKSLISEQQEFLKPEVEETQDQSQTEQEEAQEDKVDVEAMKENFKAQYQNVLNEGTLVAKVGDKEIKIEGVELDKLVDMTVNPNLQGQLFFDPETKQINWPRMAESLVFNLDPEKFKKLLYDRGFSEAHEAVVDDELKNSDLEDRKTAEEAQQEFDGKLDLNDPAQAKHFAENFKIVDAGV